MAALPARSFASLQPIGARRGAGSPAHPELIKAAVSPHRAPERIELVARGAGSSCFGAPVRIYSRTLGPLTIAWDYLRSGWPAGTGVSAGGTGACRRRLGARGDLLVGFSPPLDYNCNMTLEELVACDNAERQMKPVSEAVEQLLVAAQRQGSLTVGVYECAKLMNVDPDSVVLCLLALDEEDAGDIALQIHFTLIQAFCCDNDIDILRVSGMERLAALLGQADAEGAEPRDLHCLLVTNPHTDSWKSQGLAEVSSYCQQSRGNNQWVPFVSLQAR